MTKVAIPRKIRALLKEDIKQELSVLNGEIFSTEERHYLHRTLGRLNTAMLNFLTHRTVTQKELQSMISDRAIAPLVRVGLLEIVSSTTVTKKPSFTMAIRVDENGEPLSVAVDSLLVTKDFDLSNLPLDISLSDFIYRCIGMFYRKEA